MIAEPYSCSRGSGCVINALGILEDSSLLRRDTCWDVIHVVVENGA